MSPRIAVADLWLDRSYGSGDAPAADRARFRWRRTEAKYDEYD